MAEKPQRTNILFRHPVLVLIGTVFVGSLGSGLWDIGVKPAGAWLAQAFLDFITFGSVAMKDAACEAAALDQTAIPAARLHMAYTAFMIVPFFYFVLFEFGLLRLVRSLKQEEVRNAIASRAGQLVTLRRVLIASFGLICGFMLARQMIHNQSLLIWRCFHADVRQCAPQLSAIEEELLHANYAGMKTRDQYFRIIKPLQDIAESNGLVLHSEKLW